MPPTVLASALAAIKVTSSYVFDWFIHHELCFVILIEKRFRQVTKAEHYVIDNKQMFVVYVRN
jgi:hypothetical protein